MARNTRELIDISEIFRDHDSDLVSLQESIDTSTPGGRNLFRIMGSFAEWEREEIADRVAASVPVRAKLGKPLGGAAPFGFAWVDGKFVPDEREAPVRRLMYELFRETRRIKTVARLLNERGFRTRSGRLFTNTTVRRLLLDPTAKGVRRGNYTQSLGDGKKWKLKPVAEWVEVPIPAIVDEAVWTECATILRERADGATKPGPRPVHLFTGIVHCSCGRKMYVPSNSPKWVCYGCRNKIPVPDLEAVFAEQLKSFVFSPEAVASHLGEVDTVTSTKRELLETLRREEAGVRAEQEKLYRLYLEGGLAVSGFRERNAPLEKRKEELQAEIPRLQGEIDFLTIRQISSSQVLAEAQSLYERWDSLSSALKREVVETIVGRITVGKGEVEIDLASLSHTLHPEPQLPPSPELVAEGERIVRGSLLRGERNERGTAASRARAGRPP